MGTHNLAGLHVLLLEDEVLIAMDVEQVCLDHGAERVTLRRAVTELNEIWAEDFDVAVIDLSLSGESTVPFARELRDRGIPFIFASGYSDTASLAAEFPGVGLVSKPYSDRMLVSAITKAVAESGS